MTFVTYAPTRNFAHATHANRWHQAMNSYLNQAEANCQQCDWAPRLDARETDEALIFTVDLPGVKKEDVKVTVKDDVLSISGTRSGHEERESYFRIERGTGKFNREFTLYTKINADAISATMSDGVLELVLPKAEEVKPREIQIN